MRRFSTKQSPKPTVWCPFLHRLGEKLLVVAQKCTFCRIACLREKKVGEVKQAKLKKKEISFSEGGGAAWLLTKQLQSVGPVLLQCSLRARGPGGTTAAVQVCGGREREGIFFFSASFQTAGA